MATTLTPLDTDPREPRSVTPTGRVRWRLMLLGLSVVLCGISALALRVGVVDLSWNVLVKTLLGQASDHMTQTVVFELRLPRIVLAVVIGIALGMAGAAYQAVFRNPLADPFVVGASSGAALGATLAIALGWSAQWGALSPASTGAFLGALLAVLLAYGVATAGRLPPIHLLLAGAAISTMLGSLVWLVLAFADRDLHQIIGWLMGGLAGRGWGDFRQTVVWMVVGGGVLLTLARPLDALSCGDQAARALGLPVERILGLTLASASLAVAASVAAAGVIGFVGLIAPHVARALVGGVHRRVLPASGLVGAILLVGSDLLARSVVPPLELPLGVVTALLGGPFFLVILLQRRRSTLEGGG